MSIKAKDVMKGLIEIPVLPKNASLKKTLDMMNQMQLGTACFIGSSGDLVGVLTDGDLRRLVLSKQSPLPALLITDALIFGNTMPVTAQESDDIDMIRELMDRKCVWDMPIVDSNNKLLGLVHRHNVN